MGPQPTHTLSASEMRHYSRAGVRPRERSRLQLTPDSVGGTRIAADAPQSAAADALLLYI